MRVTNGEAGQSIVIDNGIGIPPENLTRIFNHGFTTREGGHGFGLHSGALAAKEMGGTLPRTATALAAAPRSLSNCPCNPTPPMPDSINHPNTAASW